MKLLFLVLAIPLIFAVALARQAQAQNYAPNSATPHNSPN